MRFQYILGVIFTIFNITDLLNITDFMVKNVRPIMYFSFWPQSGWTYLLYIILIYIGASAYIIKILIDQHRTNTTRRQQIKYLFLASSIGFAAGFTNFPLWFGVKIPPLGNMLVMLYMFFISYAMIKYKLMDVKMAATQFFTAMVLILLGIQTFRSENLQDFILNIGILAASFVFSILLIRGVIKENKFKEDITSLAMRLQQANSELKRLDQAKSEFISIASHQLRTPLTAISGYTSLMLEGTYGKINDKAQEVLKKIMDVNRGLIDLVNDLLNLSRIESGKIAYDFKPNSLVDIVEKTVNELDNLAHTKNLQLLWNRPDFAPLLMLDKDKIQNVVMNLIDNAIKYTPKGKVEVRVSQKENELVFCVKDSGMGISPETLKELFKKFVRSEEGRHVNATGTGLGLYIAKNIVEAHHGKIWAESEGVEKGSCFFISLPLQP